jgi:predicted amidohydrolase YtcJ
LKEPYLVPPENQPKNYTGYPIYTNQSELNALVQEMYNKKLQILAHVNGDAAIEQFISAIASAKRDSKPVT